MTNICQTTSVIRRRRESGVFTKFALEASTLSRLFHIQIVMMENLLSQAEVWGFLVESNRNGNWQVLPQQPTENWKLQQTEDRWLLIIGNVSQVKLNPNEAISFLNRRLPKQRNRSRCA
jgi:hypothetical protein